MWNAPDAIEHIRYGSDYAYVVAPTKQIITDIGAGNLPNVSWAIPTAAESDHASVTDGSGPSFVASIVNAVGASQYWNSTAIFVVWDDWGGWYDHIKPPQYNYYELGFRVPLIAISPYARPAYVSHTQHEFASILNFVEETFGVTCTNPPPNCGALRYTDMRADDLSDMFNYAQTPLAFKQIPAAPLSVADQNDTRAPDDDFLFALLWSEDAVCRDLPVLVELEDDVHRALGEVRAIRVFVLVRIAAHERETLIITLLVHLIRENADLGSRDLRLELIVEVRCHAVWIVVVYCLRRAVG